MSQRGRGRAGRRAGGRGEDQQNVFQQQFQDMAAKIQELTEGLAQAQGLIGGVGKGAAVEREKQRQIEAAISASQSCDTELLRFTAGGDSGLSSQIALFKQSFKLLSVIQYNLNQSYKVDPLPPFDPDDPDTPRFEAQIQAREKIFKDLAKSLRLAGVQVVAAHEASLFPDAHKRFRFQQALLETMTAAAQRDPEVPLPVGQYQDLLAKPDKATREAAEKAAKPERESDRHWSDRGYGKETGSSRSRGSGGSGWHHPYPGPPSK